jgi:alanyl-tRNA synthetase
MQLYNDKGEAVDALTPEEAEQKADEMKKEALAEAEVRRQEEVDIFLKEKEQLEQEKKDLEDQLAKAGNKEINFGNLRKSAEAKDKQIDELTKKIEGLEGTFNKKIEEFSSKQLNDLKEEMMGGFDKDTKEKIEFYYKSFSGNPQNKEELRQRVENAKILAQGGIKKPLFSGSAMSSAGGIGNIFEEKPKGKFDNPESADVAKKMGLSDKEISELL